ncbi:hypothetical protein LRR81_00690 [Metabacillus sp. GX 13764]|uniref:hypothetical protein n=1 Tax=Metabacillus kandeliae TaxID=2900151 RepID=UPI001E308E80|nr:hypothetical protein [Metabacillus kandeliae]MCD7032726.1 hypothetical protein [Metabacillus kandeliae]
MTDQQMEDLFDFSGQYGLYSKIRYPLWLSGTLDDADPELVESFLAHYQFSEQTLFDQFIFHYRIFSSIYEKDKFPAVF